MTGSVQSDCLGPEHLPGAPGEMPDDKFEICRDDAVKPERGRVGPFVDLMEDLFPDDQTRKWVNYWLAHSVQHPDKRLRTRIVVYGQKSKGQTIFEHILLPKIFGPSKVAKINAGDLKSGWKSGIKGKQIIVAEEVAAGDMLRLYDTLKDTTSGGRESGPSPEIDNFANLIFLSNHGPAVDLKKGDGRYPVSRAADKLSGSKIEAIRDWVENGGAERVRFYLEHVKLDRFDPYGNPPSGH